MEQECQNNREFSGRRKQHSIDNNESSYRGGGESLDHSTFDIFDKFISRQKDRHRKRLKVVDLSPSPILPHMDEELVEIFLRLEQWRLEMNDSNYVALLTECIDFLGFLAQGLISRGDFVQYLTDIGELHVDERLVLSRVQVLNLVNGASRLVLDLSSPASLKALHYYNSKNAFKGISALERKDAEEAARVFFEEQHLL